MDPRVAADRRRPALRIRVEATDPRNAGLRLGGRLELVDDGSRTALALLSAEFATGDGLTVGQALRTRERALHLADDDDQEEEDREAAQDFQGETGHAASSTFGTVAQTVARCSTSARRRSQPLPNVSKVDSER